MKKLLKLGAVLAALTLALACFTACGGGSAGGGDDSGGGSKIKLPGADKLKEKIDSVEDEDDFRIALQNMGFTYEQATEILGDNTFYELKKMSGEELKEILEDAMNAIVLTREDVFLQLLEEGMVVSAVSLYDYTYTADSYYFKLADGVTEIDTFVIDKKYNEIGKEAFAYLPIKSIEIPAGIKKICKEAFYNCSKLESVIFAEGSQLKEIGSYAFLLEEITIPASVKKISSEAFYGCKKVKFEEDSQLKEIGDDFFGRYYTEEIEIPANVEKIGEKAFANYENLKKVTFAEGSKLEEIGENAFYECKSLTEITIPESVTKIGEKAFCNTPLTEITIPEGVTTIGNAALYCENLNKVTTLSTTPPEGFVECMNYIKVEAIYVPAESVEAYKNAINDYYSNKDEYKAKIKAIGSE